MVVDILSVLSDVFCRVESHLACGFTSLCYMEDLPHYILYGDIRRGSADVAHREHTSYGKVKQLLECWVGGIVGW